LGAISFGSLCVWTADDTLRRVASPIRRRVTAIVTCIALGFATFGYLQRNAWEGANEARPALEKCHVPKHERDRILGCLTLLDG
jgi:hypothetical protein